MTDQEWKKILDCFDFNGWLLQIKLLLTNKEKTLLLSNILYLYERIRLAQRYAR